MGSPYGGRTERQRATTVNAAPGTFAVAGHPVHPMLIPFPIAFLVGALLTDLAMIVWGDPFFARMSAWLLGAGVTTGALAAIPGAVDLFTTSRARRSRAGKIHAWGNGAVLVLAIINLALRIVGDVTAGVTPWGIALSGLVAALLGVTGWFGGELSYRLMVGVDPAPALTVERETRLE